MKIVEIRNARTGVTNTDEEWILIKNDGPHIWEIHNWEISDQTATQRRVVAGLFFDANGFLDLGQSPRWTARQSARPIAGHPDGTAVLEQSVERVAQAADAGMVRSDEKGRASAADEATLVATSSESGTVAELWGRAAEKLAPRALAG